MTRKSVVFSLQNHSVNCACETEWYGVMNWAKASTRKKGIRATSICVVGSQVGEEAAVHRGT
jgi:hypothetical protein